MPRKRRDSDEDSERGAASRRAPIYAVLARELLRHLGDTLPGVLAPGRGDRGRTLALVGASKLAPEPPSPSDLSRKHAQPFCVARGSSAMRSTRATICTPSSPPARLALATIGLHRRMVGPSGRS
jgi:hypothetical protein